MAGVGQAYENVYAERLMKTIKEEEVDLSGYRNFNEVYERIEAFLEEASHSEFEAEWRKAQ